VGLLFVALLHSATAQLQVDIGLRRTLYIAYEPLIVNVSITNLTGNPVVLSDSNRARWFGFQIETLDGRPIAPRSQDYTNPQVVLEAGQKMTRAINITPLYPIAEFGGYRIRASIYEPSSGSYFSSPPLNVEITDGRSLFKKTVGVPGQDALRTISLLSHRLPASTQLYIRIEDEKKGTIFCTHRLGRIVSYGAPEILLDKKNEVHVLQNVAPKAFLYSHIGLNGEVLARKSYTQIVKRPSLLDRVEGGIAVIGAREINPELEASKPPLPSLSDRPVPLPKATTRTPADEKRPKNLLSQ
jgi:hypothetical protein